MIHEVEPSEILRKTCTSLLMKISYILMFVGFFISFALVEFKHIFPEYIGKYISGYMFIPIIPMCILILLLFVLVVDNSWRVFVLNNYIKRNMTDKSGYFTHNTGMDIRHVLKKDKRKE